MKVNAQKIKQFRERYSPEIVVALIGITAFFLVHRQWTPLPKVLLLASLVLAVPFTSGWHRVVYCVLVGLQGVIDRHFILHYSSCIRKAGSQALITTHITDPDEVFSYVKSIFPVEYVIVTLFVAVVAFLVIRRKSPPLKKCIWGVAGAFLLFAGNLACNVIPPIWEYQADWENQQEYYMAHRQHTFHATDTRPGNREVALLIIGESHRYDEMERLFQEQELPHFCQARQEGMLYSFSNLITHYPQTYFSVFTLLSRRTPDTLNRFWPEKGLLALFREAGWHVVYLTYQNMNLLEYGYDSVVNEGDEYINHRHTSGTKLDTGMLPIMQRKVSENTGKLLIVVKMTGCHFPSASPHRYPDEARRYLPDGRDEKSNPMSGRPEDILRMKNAYRNAILFSGKFIDSILQCVMETEQPGFMVFLSDHGIINYDDGENAYFGKAKSNYHIPAYLYLNNAYRKQFLTAETDEKLRGRQDASLTNSYIFDTVETLAGITDPGHREKFDLTGEGFQETVNRKVWLWDEQFEYDALK